MCSLKNAFASGLTAGATAGLGNLMGVGGTAKGTFVNGATYAKDGTQIAAASLNGIGKMTMAASAAGISVGANKLAGNNKASFQWRNVVTGAATAGLMHKMGITDTESSWSKATNNLRFEADVLNGFAGAAVGYGVSKGLYNEGSWNFRNVATDVFGNAIGNSIVAKAQSIEQIRSNAAAAQRGLSGAVQTTLDDDFNGQVNHNAAQIGANLFADSARQFDNAAEQRLLDADAFNQSYLDKRTGAIDGYLNMSQKTQRDIQSIDTRTATSRQQRAMQAAQIQQRYDQRTMDFRMANPVHRGSAPLFDYNSALAADNAMWGAGKQRAQGFRDGIAAGVDLIERSANAYGKAFEKAGDAFVKSYENVKKFPDVLQSGWDKALTLLPDSGGYTFALGVSGGYEAGFGAQGAKGDLVTIDFESKKIITASYWSAQGGSNVGIPAADVGAEFTYFRSERFRDIFEGMYNATGGQVAAGVGVTVDKITTMPKIGDPIMHGWQATVGFGTPQADIHTHFGYGGIIKGTYQETKFSDIPTNIWRHLWF